MLPGIRAEPAPFHGQNPPPRAIPVHPATGEATACHIA
jgi:hypothetical protein